MSQRGKVNLTKYCGSAIFVGLMVWAYLALRDYKADGLAGWYQMICDGLTIPGFLLLAAGGLTWASSQGAMDGFSYAARYALFSLIPGKRLERDEKYGDYVARKRENRATGYSFLFVSGGVTLVLALIFMALYYFA